MNKLTLSSPASSRDLFLKTLLNEKARRAALLTGVQDDIEAVRARCKTLYGFVKEAWAILEPGTPFIDNWHIRAICEHLEAVTRGQITRLQVNIPPGCMKSLLVAVFWPAWEWGPAAMPWLRYLGTSYDLDYAERDSRKMRELVQSTWYQTLWPIHLLTTGAGDFENTQRGGRVAKVFANLTGGRGNRLFLDDPHSVDSAENPNERMKVTRRFRESLQSRLNDQRRDAIIVIMQRLNPRDVCGVIEELGLPYVKLILPMEFEPKRKCITHFGGKTWEDPRAKEGDLLFPEMFPASVVKALKTSMGGHAYAGQYQQRPSAREGGMFRREWFKAVEAVPAAAKRKVRRWDLAATIQQDGNDPDWTVGLKMSTDGLSFYIEHVTRFRNSGMLVRRAIKAAAIVDGRACPIEIPQDPGQAGKDQAKNIIAENAGSLISAFRETGDKGTRAEPFAAQLEAGNVLLLKGDWNEEFIDELCLAEDTLITTIHGDVQIKDVRRGDLVMTRHGWKRVAEARMTNEAAEICEIGLSTGGLLRCTLNHPILVNGSSFKKAGHLRAEDRLSRFIEASPSNSHLVQKNSISLGASVKKQSNSTGMSGCKSEGRSLQGTTSTMLMMIAGITLSAILNAFQRLSTRCDTGNGKSHGQRAPRNVWSANVNSLPHKGFERVPVQKGVATKINWRSAINGRIEKFASTVMSLSWALLVRRTVSVLVPVAVLMRQGVGASHSTNRLADNAEAYLFRRTPDRCNFVDDVAVLSLDMLPGKHRVYNLEVEDVHEFVANGVIVHNCAFPQGHDDQVDAASGAFNFLTRKAAPMVISDAILQRARIPQR